MKKHFLLLFIGLHLLACSKDSTEPVPAAIITAFGQEFDLRYRQQALLTALQSPELTVKLTDLSYAICPKNSLCFLPDSATPTLAITDAQGQTQQLILGGSHPRPNTFDYLDSASVRANGRRYMVYFTKWRIDGAASAPQQKDFLITLRVAK